MLITPTATPLTLTDLSQNNQTQHQYVQNAEQSKKNTDTVQLSAQARKLAASNLSAGSASPLAIPAALSSGADREASEVKADNEVTEQQRPRNPLTRMPETTKINILA